MISFIFKSTFYKVHNRYKKFAKTVNIHEWFCKATFKQNRETPESPDQTAPSRAEVVWWGSSLFAHNGLSQYSDYHTVSNPKTFLLFTKIYHNVIIQLLNFWVTSKEKGYGLILVYSQAQDFVSQYLGYVGIYSTSSNHKSSLLFTFTNYHVKS